MQSQVSELLNPAVIVAVLPRRAQFAEIAVAGGAEFWSIETKDR
jgi:hypothetical protein